MKIQIEKESSFDEQRASSRQLDDFNLIENDNKQLNSKESNCLEESKETSQLQDKSQRNSKRLRAVLITVLVIVVLLAFLSWTIKSKFMQEEAFLEQNISSQKIEESEENKKNNNYNFQNRRWTEPLLGKMKQDRQFNFSQVTLKQTHEYQQMMLSFFKPYNDTNCDLERISHQQGENYLICRNLFHQTEAFINIGIQENDDFGCRLTTRLKIPNYQYDCNLNYAPQCKTNENKDLFQKVCLTDRSYKENGKKFESMKDVIDKRGLRGKQATVKIDVEGAEWAGLRSLPFEYLDGIDQLIMEFHNPYSEVIYPAFWGNIDVLRAIDEKFASVNLHMNDCYRESDLPNHAMPGFAIEVTFVNRRLLTIHSPTRSFHLHPLNAPQPQCQIIE